MSSQNKGVYRDIYKSALDVLGLLLLDLFVVVLEAGSVGDHGVLGGRHVLVLDGGHYQ